jgi:hypothetical protein
MVQPTAAATSPSRICYNALKPICSSTIRRLQHVHFTAVTADPCTCCLHKSMTCAGLQLGSAVLRKCDSCAGLSLESAELEKCGSCSSAMQASPHPPPAVCVYKHIGQQCAPPSLPCSRRQCDADHAYVTAVSHACSTRRRLSQSLLREGMQRSRRSRQCNLASRSRQSADNRKQSAHCSNKTQLVCQSLSS